MQTNLTNSFSKLDNGETLKNTEILIVQSDPISDPIRRFSPLEMEDEGICMVWRGRVDISVPNFEAEPHR